MKKKIVLSLVLVLSLFLVVGCGKKEAIAGTWQGKSTDGIKVTLTFDNGKFTYKNDYSSTEGTYKIKDDVVTISAEAWSKDKEYKFEIKDGKLSLTANDIISPNYKDLEKK